MAVLALHACACGGQTNDLDGGRDDAAFDAADWTTCSSPNGQRVCKGPNACPSDDPVCAGGCLNGAGFTGMPDALGACGRSPGLKVGIYCWDAPDGDVCLSLAPPGPSVDWAPGAGSFELGLLFLQNGAGARVRYADLGLFDGTPLPLPTACPTLQSVRICGGNCGGCAPNEVCHGRSPLHPYGFCIAALAGYVDRCDFAKPACTRPIDDCFAFTVQTEAQALGDRHAICVPKAGCQELETKYPGGGKCAGL